MAAVTRRLGKISDVVRNYEPCKYKDHLPLKDFIFNLAEVRDTFLNVVFF